MRVTRLGELADAMAALRAHDGAALLEVKVEEEENVFPIVPPGGANTEAVLAKP